ncbi:MAG: DedA family protein [Elusimicrobiales bacterium]|nr:DedA family protein [Elusimicrobiales bacterium]
MEFVYKFVDIILHLDNYLDIIISSYGNYFYVILFIIIFCETGLVITPFLPGDSLLFACGAFAARGSIEPFITSSIIFFGGVLGDGVNYHVGKFLGKKAIDRYPKIFKKEYIEKTHNFYEKYGGKTIIIARFVPIVRTFAPFLAGVGYMSYFRFLVYNVVGAFLWVIIVFGGGYFFGNIEFVKKNFSIVIITIIIISIMPIIFEYFKTKK